MKILKEEVTKIRAATDVFSRRTSQYTTEGDKKDMELLRIELQSLKEELE